MINELDIRWVAEHRENCWFSIDDCDNVIDKESNKILGKIGEFVMTLRALTHCDFEILYTCYETKETIYRCKECGTIIFCCEDELYDPNLCCPTCGEYKTHLKYWTVKDIEKDPNKKYIVNFYNGIHRKNELEQSMSDAVKKCNLITYIEKYLYKIKNKIIKLLDKQINI